MRMFVACVLLACYCFPSLFQAQRLLHRMVCDNDQHANYYDYSYQEEEQSAQQRRGSSASSSASSSVLKNHHHYHDRTKNGENADDQNSNVVVDRRHNVWNDFTIPGKEEEIHLHHTNNNNVTKNESSASTTSSSVPLTKKQQELLYFVLTMPERRQRVERVLTAVPGLTRVHYVEGLRGQDLTLRRLEDDGVIRRRQSSFFNYCPLTMNQVAVHLGHLRMLELFRDEFPDEEMAVFLEDDILPRGDRDDFAAQVQAIVQDAPPAWELINLGRCRATCQQQQQQQQQPDNNDNNNNETDVTKQAAYHYIPRYEQCRTAFVVHRRGLNKLLRLSLPLEQLPGDKHWHALSMNRAVQAYSSIPSIATQSRNETGSYLRVVYDSLHECAEDDPPLRQQIVAFVRSWSYRMVSQIVYGTVM
jgi:hypothetical protein